MSFSGTTPEALLDRSDSKNPATTCKGLNQNGRPCRRDLKGNLGGTPLPSPGTTPNSRSVDDSDVLAIVTSGNATAFFCWQHKDQADGLVARLRQAQQKTKILHLQQRSSIDTLAERLGVFDLDEDTGATPSKHSRSKDTNKFKKQEILAGNEQQIRPSLASPPQIATTQGRSLPNSRPTYSKPRSVARQSGTSWSCCIRTDDDYNDDGPPVRRRQDHSSLPQARRQSFSRPSTTQTTPRPPSVSQPVASQPQAYSTPTRPAPSSYPTTPVSPWGTPLTRTQSQTQALLSLIPPHLPPQTTSALLSELSKPISTHDEAGYIYILWLTPESAQDVPDDETTTSIFGDLDSYVSDPPQTPPSSSRSPPSRRLHNQTRTYNPGSSPSHPSQQALRRFASVKATATAPPKILLKIGRAVNVHRRISQWTKQCGQNITLVRHYPYHRDVMAAAAAANSLGREKVPHVHRVERLIHLELGGMRAEKGACGVCGRTHKEWFEVEGTREELRVVDGVIRRWVAWAEAQP